MLQRYLQSTTMRVEEMRVKRTDAERWMSHRMLPEELRARVRRYQQYKWQLTRGVEEENLLQSLPKDLRRDITRHLCLSLLKSVRIFLLNFFFSIHLFVQLLAIVFIKSILSFRCQCLKKWIVNCLMHFVIVSNQFFTQRRAALSLRGIQWMRCSLSCEET